MRAAASLPVRLIGSKNCFVQLPAHVGRALAPAASPASGGAVILKLSWEDSISIPSVPGAAAVQSAVVSWNGGLCEAGSDCLEVPQALARTLGLDRLLDLDPYLAVRVQPLEYVANAARVDVEPCTPDDWEILELNAEHLEGELLQQVGISYEIATTSVLIAYCLLQGVLRAC
jgi:Peroxisome biogenesis factor 1, N-terminal